MHLLYLQICEFHPIDVFSDELKFDSFDSVVAVPIIENQKLPINYDFADYSFEVIIDVLGFFEDSLEGGVLLHNVFIVDVSAVPLQGLSVLNCN
jgi:hypothetical protein